MRYGDQTSTTALAQRIVESVRRPIALSTGETVGIGVSVGIASYTDSVSSASALLAQADKALYEAKRESPDRRVLSRRALE
jgi:diguanylate cyclase (GGDEF)-like protein